MPNPNTISNKYGLDSLTAAIAQLRPPPLFKPPLRKLLAQGRSREKGPEVEQGNAWIIALAGKCAAVVAAR